MKPVHLNPSSPRLSEIPKRHGFEHPLQCGSCGRRADQLSVHSGLWRWQEHDHNDQPEHRLIVLCKVCSDKLIKPHVRLYRHLHPNDPWAGCMTLCVDCRWRIGTRCTHPRALSNGGVGVEVKTGTATRAFVDYGNPRRGELVTMFDTPPSECRQKEAL